MDFLVTYPKTLNIGQLNAWNGIDEHAAIKLSRTVQENPGEITILSSGPSCAFLPGVGPIIMLRNDNQTGGWIPLFQFSDEQLNVASRELVSVLSIDELYTQQDKNLKC